MANGYIRISQNDIIFDNDNNVVYWKNGGRILGEVVSCIDSNDDVHYYLKTTNIKKAILIDAFVPVGVQDYNLFSDSANFINIQINEEDFSGDGGGSGISITFLLPEGKYYTCKYVEANGDIKIYDAAGDGGQIGGGSGLPDTDTASAGDVLGLDSDKTPVWMVGAKPLYLHTFKFSNNDNLSVYYFDDKSSATVADLKTFLSASGYTSGYSYPCISGGYAFVSGAISSVPQYVFYDNNEIKCSRKKSGGSFESIGLDETNVNIKTARII